MTEFILKEIVVSKRRLQRGLQRRLQTGYGRGLAVKLRSGLVQVLFSLQPKFNSFELNSEVGRLVIGCMEIGGSSHWGNLGLTRNCTLIWMMMKMSNMSLGRSLRC